MIEWLGILAWLMVTILIGTVTTLLGKKYGVEYLIAMFVGAIVIANAVASKMISIGPFTTSAALVVYSITFLLTDTISEFWGKKEARKAVWSGFLALIMLVFVTQISIALTPASFWEGQEAFKFIFGNTWRVALGSFIAYAIAQNHDVWSYHWWMRKTGRKHMWMRNNFSTWISQTIDTLIFVTIAFYGIFPIGGLIVSTIFLKMVIAAVDTPFLYFIKWYYEKTGKRWKGKPTSLNVPGI